MEDMILDRPSSSNETSDRISQLPEHIILRILFFLPAKDAARSSILSKTWLPVWKSLPIFSFSSDTFSRKANLLKQDASFDAEADGYMDLIEKSLEKLRDHKVEHVKLVDHPKLNNVTIQGVPFIRIEAKSLENFHCVYRGNKPLELHLVSCENLQMLNLRTRFTSEYIQEMVAKTPLLRTLILSPYISLERLKISSPSLLVLVICAAERGVDEKEIEIDAPNLERYRFSVAKGKTAATPVFINSARLQVAELSKHLFPPDIPSQWFIHLMNCLPSFEYNVLRISVWHDMTNKDTVLESLRQISAAPVYLDVLSFIVCLRSFDFAAFFDCCFWICRPKMIIIKITCENTADLEDQLQRVKLIPREENPACCRNSQRKCWQHYIDDVKPLKAIKMKDDTYVRNCHDNGIALTSSEVEVIAIQLEWKMTGQKRNHRWVSSQNLFEEHRFQFILR
ncbi:hypothetical protein V6N13_023822 [Hibiscus sabdariffa]|uniref:F-box domain-containing protein n=1 Tax=Hibiscus sabdariffa TaxID=183260 RepID=A0ABR2PMW1_9ROSI